MTRILAVTSGLEQVGKSQLALNLSLELVRRGRWVGLFHDQVDSASIDRLVSLPEAGFREPREGEERPVDLLRRGYQGADIISCRLPLSEWVHSAPARITHVIGEFDIAEGYDDLIIDTSGMSEHELLACCLASAVVILVVTPEPASQAAAFALLRILRLNDYEGSVRLLVNRVPYAMDASDIHRSFSEHARTWLDIDIPLLEVMLEDKHIRLAEQSRQAFSTVFPEAEATGCLVVIADQVEELPVSGWPLSVRDYWGRVRELLARPLVLPGHATLGEDGLVSAGSQQGVTEG